MFLLQTVMEFENEFDLREHSFGLGPEEEGVAKILVIKAVYASRKLSTNSCVPGRIGRPEFYSFWEKELQASDFILSTIRHRISFYFCSS